MQSFAYIVLFSECSVYFVVSKSTLAVLCRRRFPWFRYDRIVA